MGQGNVVQELRPKKQEEVLTDDCLWKPEQAMRFLQIDSKTTFHRALKTEEPEIPRMYIGSKLRFVPELMRAWAKKKAAMTKKGLAV